MISEPANSIGPEPITTVRAVLAEIGWDKQSREQGENIFIDLIVEDVPIAYAHIAVSHELKQLVIYLVLGVLAPVDRVDDCASLLADINHDILVGGFDLDVQSGRIAFKDGVSFRDTVLRRQDVRNIILGSMVATETYIDLILAVINGQPSREAMREFRSRGESIT